MNAGATLELWVIGLDGKFTIRCCGTAPNAEPTVRFTAGDIFASKLAPDASDGTFVTCITVSRFTYDGFQMYEKEQIIDMYSETATFWEG